MAYVHIDTANGHDNLLSQLRISWIIRIPVNSVHGRDRSKLIENLRSANITCVKDQAHALKRFMHRSTKKSVCIADETNDDGI